MEGINRGLRGKVKACPAVKLYPNGKEARSGKVLAGVEIGGRRGGTFAPGFAHGGIRNAKRSIGCVAALQLS